MRSLMLDARRRLRGRLRLDRFGPKRFELPWAISAYGPYDKKVSPVERATRFLSPVPTATVSGNLNVIPSG